MTETSPPGQPGPADWGKDTRHAEEGQFLEGPNTRGFELRRALRMFWELLRGFRALHFVGPCVTVFGSARTPESHPHYELAREMGRRLALAGFTVMTGGGPGIMEAANRGAKDVGGHSIGCNITLPNEQKPNAFLDRWVQFRYFFIRKVMLVKYSYAFIGLPGGFGTMDELFETATLIQTGKISNFPLVLMGVEFWQPLIEFLRDRMARDGTIAASDLATIQLTDSPSQAMEMILTRSAGFGLRWQRAVKPHWMLGEDGRLQAQAASTIEAKKRAAANGRLEP
ncbi:MAG: TIGR00730 family Rossman fold protein [Acidobacteriota bacterium]